MNTSEFKTMARRFGADLVGIAPYERFDGLKSEQHPRSIFPQGKSVVVIGRRILRGSLRGIEEHSEMMSIYQNFGLFALEDQFLAKTSYDIVMFVEKLGREAVPLFAYEWNGENQGTPVAPGKPGPNVHIPPRFAAVKAGLGVIGRHGMLLTPEYGTRQRLAMLLTDLELDADPELELDYCSGCQDCVKACPLDALAADGHYDERRCRKCGNGAVACDAGRFFAIDRVAASCGRACLASLERRGLLKQKFNHPFRVRAPWSCDAAGKFSRAMEAVK
ncbi:MAG: hypothetical protein AB7F32_12760 [Victivallaceae bacterium]